MVSLFGAVVVPWCRLLFFVVDVVWLCLLLKSANVCSRCWLLLLLVDGVAFCCCALTIDNAAVVVY